MIKFSHKELIIPYFILFIVLVLSIYPLLYMISTSLMTAGEASNQYLFPKKLMFENYLEVWKSNNFQKYTLNSIIISFVIVTGVLFTSIPAAYAFAKIQFPFRDTIFYGLLLALTSNDFSQKFLGGSSWKFLQQSVNIFWVLVLLHTSYFLYFNFLDYDKDLPKPSWLQIPFLIILILVMSFKILTYIKMVKKNKIKNN